MNWSDPRWHDDILTTNTLSRKKGQNINKILNRVENGEKIEDIICEIYNIDILPEAETNLEKIKNTRVNTKILLEFNIVSNYQYCKYKKEICISKCGFLFYTH